MKHASAATTSSKCGLPISREVPSFYVSPSQAAINAFYPKCDGNNISLIWLLSLNIATLKLPIF